MKDYTQANNLIANSSQFAHAVDNGIPYRTREKPFPLGSRHYYSIPHEMCCCIGKEIGCASAILEFLVTGHSLALLFWPLSPPRLNFYSHVVLTSQSSSLWGNALNIIHQDSSLLYYEAQAIARIYSAWKKRKNPIICGSFISVAVFTQTELVYEKKREIYLCLRDGCHILFVLFGLHVTVFMVISLGACGRRPVWGTFLGQPHIIIQIV